jgi:hypothetical protein
VCGAVAAGCGAVANVDGPSAAAGTPYLLLAPISSRVTYLIDLDGQVVHTWRSEQTPGLSVYLLPNGNLLRTNSLGAGSFPGTGGNGGRVQELDWDGNVRWSFDYFASDHQQHHDVRKLPNGNVLMVAWEERSGAEAQAVGRDATTIPGSNQVWPDTVIEVEPESNQIVWRWRVWDHLLAPGDNPADHPELIDPNAHATANSADWTHVNAIDYNATLDQLLISSRNLSEIWIVDHSTTLDEAASHSGGRSGRGGDLLFRWGSPGNYGLDGTQQLYGQHNAQWIADGLDGAGQVLVFDNGDRTFRPFSRGVQLVPQRMDDGSYAYDPAAGFAPDAPAWQYSANPPESFFAALISSVQRLPNGNTQLCDGPAGHVFEVTPSGDTVWTYTLTDTKGATGVQVFRAVRYDSSYPGLAGRTLTPQGPLKVELAN